MLNVIMPFFCFPLFELCVIRSKFHGSMELSLKVKKIYQSTSGQHGSAFVEGFTIICLKKPQNLISKAGNAKQHTFVKMVSVGWCPSVSLAFFVVFQVLFFGMYHRVRE